MIRCFFAISVPTEVGVKLRELTPPVPAIRRVRPEGLHVTLRFLRQAPEDLAGQVRLEGLPGAFTLAPTRLLLLPESGPVRVIAVGVSGGEGGLQRLRNQIDAELARLGIEPEERRFLPHLTLARCDPPLPQQVRAQRPMQLREPLAIPVRQIELIESRAAGTGREYCLLRSWPLPDPAATT